MIKTLGNLNIKTTAYIIAITLFLVAAGVVVVSAFAIKETRNMADMWTNFNAGPAQKTVALGKLRSALGYGGTIHEFKNFIIRQDRQRIVKVNVSLQNVAVALTAYESFGINNTERAALAKLKEVMARYASAVTLAERMVSEGASIIDIDKAVRIDDTPAILAMETLDRELRAARERRSGQVHASVSKVTTLVSTEAIVITALIGVLVAVFMWFTIWRLVRPISELGKAMENLDISSISNMGGLDQRLSTNGLREIAELARTFNDMAAKLDVAAHKERELQKELREAQKLEAVGQLAGGIAHEINTPAQYIGDNLKFLTDVHKDLFSLVESSLTLAEAAHKHDDLATMAGDVKNISNDIDLEYLREEIPSATEQSLLGIGQVSRIVLAMKEFSHPGAKEKSLTDINKALENTLTISRNEWKHVAEMTTAFDQALPAVSCFAGELNQVFLNLIVNAAHAISDKPGRAGLGKIKVSTETDGENVVIRIEDDGTGIPEDIRDKVFNPFFTTKEVGKGTGQGLAIARDIVVKKHGGKLTFDTVEGEGTSLIVQLPIRALIAEAEEAEN